MENAVIYARYSSHNQTENSIEAQVAEAKQYAKLKNYTVVEIFADRAKTGTNDSREQFQRMLSSTEYHNFTVIIVWKVDRFGRNREEIALNKYRCKKNGVRVEYVAENITDGPEGVILESVLEGFAEYYSRQLSQNTKRGLKNLAKKGEYSGGSLPYGYKVEDGKYKIVPEEAKKIKEVFKLFASGLSFSEIARRLDLKHYNIPHYLTFRTYADGVCRRCGVEIENIMPPIIDIDTFNSIQPKLSKSTKRRKPDEYILTGKIFCKSCGKKFIGSKCTVKDHPYSYYRSTCTCNGHYTNIKKTDVESDVVSKALEILKSDTAIDTVSMRVHEKLKLHFKNITPPASKDALLRRKENLIDAVEKGVLEMNDVSERLAKINKELSNTTKEYNVPSVKEIKDYILKMRDITSNRVLVGMFVENIIVDPTSKLYEIRFGPSDFSVN